MSKNNEDTTPDETKPATRLVNAGRDSASYYGFVNPPVYHGSTVLYANAADQLAHRGRYVYGRRGTPTSEALETALRELEGSACAGVSLLPSGAAAISTALLSILDAEDHLLVCDNVYLPTRHFCERVLTRFGITTTYYDPLIGADIAKLLTPKTRAVFVESPGSLSFEVADLPAISKAAHAHDCVVLLDNTWGTPLYFRAFDKGADLAIYAGTKYFGGHSDVMIGTVAANGKTWPRLRDTVSTMGLCVGPDDIYLTLRGLRTMDVRLERHQRSAMKIAQWLQDRPEVLRVINVALPDDPGHQVWKRDFSGHCGLFSFVLKPVAEKAVHAFTDALALFGLGYSWGGYESLAIIFDCTSSRTATRWNPGGPTLRLHIGLEDPDDLIADLARGFAALNAAK